VVSICIHCTYSWFSKRRPSAILDFHFFALSVKNSNLRLCRPAKFGEDRMMRGRVIAYFLFSKWRPSAITATCVCWSEHPLEIAPWSCLYFAIYRDFYIRPVWLLLPIHAPFGGDFGDITPKWIPILLHPKNRPWVKTLRMSHKPWKSIHMFDLCACQRKIQYNQPINQEKVTKPQYFTDLGRSPRWTDWNEILH